MGSKMLSVGRSVDTTSFSGEVIAHENSKYWVRTPVGKEHIVDFEPLGLSVRVGHSVSVVVGSVQFTDRTAVLGATNHATQQHRNVGDEPDVLPTEWAKGMLSFGGALFWLMKVGAACGLILGVVGGLINAGSANNFLGSAVTFALLGAGFGLAMGLGGGVNLPLGLKASKLLKELKEFALEELKAEVARHKATQFSQTSQASKTAAAVASAA